MFRSDGIARIYQHAKYLYSLLTYQFLEMTKTPDFNDFRIRLDFPSPDADTASRMPFGASRQRSLPRRAPAYRPPGLDAELTSTRRSNSAAQLEPTSRSDAQTF